MNIFSSKQISFFTNSTAPSPIFGSNMFVASHVKPNPDCSDIWDAIIELLLDLRDNFRISSTFLSYCDRSLKSTPGDKRVVRVKIARIIPELEVQLRKRYYMKHRSFFILVWRISACLGFVILCLFSFFSVRKETYKNVYHIKRKWVIYLQCHDFLRTTVLENGSCLSRGMCLESRF